MNLILKYLFAFLLFMHGLIHVMGFAKAYQYGNITQLTKFISKPAGVFWMLTACLFITATILFLYKTESWPYLAIIAAFISQILIILVWKDARFGTIANIIIIAVATAAWGNLHFEKGFRNDVKKQLLRTNRIRTDLLREADVQSLPEPVQRYLHYSGVIDKPRVKNMRIVFEGAMRDRGRDWFTFRSVQYNFFDEPTRLFFMKGKMFGITVPGYHDYQKETARMNIKLFGLFPVMKLSGEVMNKAETVTLFNDMCLMAPASLVDKRITWEPVDSLTARATFTNGVNKITALVYFNAKGQLVNFTSDDRYAVSDMKQYRFSTPVKNYMTLNGRHVMQYGEAVWHYPEGEFVYGKFNLKSIEYNVKDFEQ